MEFALYVTGPFASLQEVGWVQWNAVIVGVKKCMVHLKVKYLFAQTVPLASMNTKVKAAVDATPFIHASTAITVTT